MVSKQIKSKRVIRTREASEVARKLWLAGLGAVSLAQKQGQKLVDTLIDEGEDFRDRTEKLATTLAKDVRRTGAEVRKRIKARITPIRQSALRAAREIEAGISARLGNVLGRFGVPSKTDIQELLGRVSDLNKQVKGSARKRAA
jgi:poly(hydroxyalkanoate) granule-associated protein